MPVDSITVVLFFIVVFLVVRMWKKTSSLKDRMASLQCVVNTLQEQQKEQEEKRERAFETEEPVEIESPIQGEIEEAVPCETELNSGDTAHTIPAETMAVIMAAVMACGYAPTAVKEIRRVSLRKQKQSKWIMAGRLAGMR